MSDEATAGEPARRGRRRLAAIIAVVGVLVAAAIAAAVVTTSGGTGQRPYASLPRPCGLLSAATLAKYTPDATWSTVPGVQASGASRDEGCVWQAGSDPMRTIIVQIALFGSPSGIRRAQQAETDWVQRVRTTAKVPAIQSVPGLGDQATEASYLQSPPAKVSGRAVRTTSLVVTSSNVILAVGYDVSRPADNLPESFPAQAADEAAIARDVLAVLASPRLAAPAPRGFTSPPPTSGSPSPDYASPRNPCTLPSAAVLAKHDHGAMVVPPTTSTASARPGSPQSLQCVWSSPDPITTTVLWVTVFPSGGDVVGGAPSLYTSAVQQAEQASAAADTTPIGTQAVTGLGEQATVIFQKQLDGGEIGSPYYAALVLWSGNAEMELTIAYSQTVPARSAQLAAVTAIARSALSAMPRT